MKFSPKLAPFFAIAAAVMLLISSAANAQNTSGSLRVVVTDESGAAVDNLPIEITHMPTGRTRTTNTIGGGAATARGLAIGGPYEVRIVSADYAADLQQGIFVSLGRTEVIEIIARSSVGLSIVRRLMACHQYRGISSAFWQQTLKFSSTIVLLEVLPCRSQAPTSVLIT
jgi:hypothetical protein